MTDAESVRIDHEATEEDVAAVNTGLREFNVEVIGPPNEEPVHLVLRDANDEVVGGLLGHIRWRWLYIAKLWISDAHRGQGHGVALMAAAEAHANARDCLGIYLDTFEYQARPFYEKLGFQLFGTLENFPPGYRQYHLAKPLAPKR
ncbi:MAG: GNAT family N-acetyltransferase [Gemmatimonadota bacterium]